MIAAKAGADAIVAELLARGVQPHADSDGKLPLVEAAQIGHARTVALLLAAKAEPDFALVHAAHNNQLAAVRTLIEQKASVNARAFNGTVSPLRAATLLLERKADTVESDRALVSAFQASAPPPWLPWLLHSHAQLAVEFTDAQVSFALCCSRLIEYSCSSLIPAAAAAGAVFAWRAAVAAGAGDRVQQARRREALHRCRGEVFASA